MRKISIIMSCIIICFGIPLGSVELGSLLTKPAEHDQFIGTHKQYGKINVEEV